ncbi:MAG: hypothetical protein ABIG20_00205 [archaeon]
MKSEVPLHKFLIVALFAVVLTIATSSFIFSGAPTISGFATATAQLVVNSTSAISVDPATTPMDFGTMDVNTQNDTTNNDPNPFIVSNDGNSFVNITIYATNIWSQSGYNNPTANYKFNSTENESNSVINPATDLTAWSNIPNTSNNSVTVVTNLEYNQTNDSIKVHLNLTVPPEEPPGSKTSTITFLGTLA